MIDQFKAEADSSYVDWNCDEEVRGFKSWLDEAANYVRVTRPSLFEQHDLSLPLFPLPPEMVGMTYEELYGKQMAIRAKIEELDLKYIKEMLDKRKFMWT